MSASRFSTLSVIALTVAAAASAQSVSAIALQRVSPSPLLSPAPARPDSRTQIPALSAPTLPATLSQPQTFSFSFSGMGCDPLDCVDGQHPMTASQPSPKIQQATPGFFHLNPGAIAPVSVVQLDESGPNPCYTMRSYQFTPNTPGSGAGKITGQTTCQSSRSVHSRAISAPAVFSPIQLSDGPIVK